MVHHNCKKVKVRVYSLVSSAKRHSPDFIQLPPGHRTCSFISHLNSPGSIQPGCHFFGARNYSNSQAFTVLPGTHLLLGRESARVSKVPCLGAQRRSIFSAAGDRTGDLSLVRRAWYHWATTPHTRTFTFIIVTWLCKTSSQMALAKVVRPADGPPLKFAYATVDTWSESTWTHLPLIRCLNDCKAKRIAIISLRFEDWWQIRMF